MCHQNPSASSPPCHKVIGSLKTLSEKSFPGGLQVACECGCSWCCHWGYLEHYHSKLVCSRQLRRCVAQLSPTVDVVKPDGGMSIWKRPLAASVAQLDAPSDWRPGGCGFNPAEVGNILSWRLIMKYFLRSFSPFRWFKKGSCQFLAKECAQYCFWWKNVHNTG